MRSLWRTELLLLHWEVLNPGLRSWLSPALRTQDREFPVVAILAVSEEGCYWWEVKWHCLVLRGKWCLWTLNSPSRGESCPQASASRCFRADLPGFSMASVWEKDTGLTAPQTGLIYKSLPKNMNNFFHGQRFGFDWWLQGARCRKTL